MVKLIFIVLDGVLALRISENKARYYKRVTHLLKGKPNLKKHWVKEKIQGPVKGRLYFPYNITPPIMVVQYWESGKLL